MARIEMQSRDMQRRAGDLITAVIRGDEVVITRYGKPIALMIPYNGEPAAHPDAGATTEYGTWNLLVGDGSQSPEDYVRRALSGDGTSHYDIAAIVDELLDEVNKVLPEGVTVNGEKVYGPYVDREGWRDRLPEIRAAIDEIPFYDIAAQHEFDHD